MSVRTGIFPVPARETRFFRSLRFRLAISYSLFFGVLLFLVGWPVRGIMRNVLERQQRDVVDEEWAATKSYLKIEKGQPVWDYDKNDAEETLYMASIRDEGVYLLMTREGAVLLQSEYFKGLPVDSRQDVVDAILSKEPVYRTVQSAKGEPHLLRKGVVLDVKKRPYYMVVGTSLAEVEKAVSGFTRYYLLFAPLAVLASTLLGWLLAGKALEPLNSVAAAARRISGANFRVKLPWRGAGDELDGLIDSFNEMTDRLEKSFEQIRQFSTDVSHELRTPLTAIRGQLEVALFTANSAEQYRDAMVNALQDVEQLSNIVRALLLLSQAESGQLVLQMDPVDLGELTNDIADQFQIPAEEQQIDLRAVVTPAPAIRVAGDRTQLGRLVTNLVSNAVKYTPNGGSVTVKVSQESGFGILTVSDTGVGIPQDHLPHIFDRFYRVRPAHTQPLQGLGLGLSFVAWIVQAHSGAIDVESEIGKGTTFTVRLPLATSDPAPAKATNPAIPVRSKP